MSTVLNSYLTFSFILALPPDCWVFCIMCVQSFVYNLQDASLFCNNNRFVLFWSTHRMFLCCWIHMLVNCICIVVWCRWCQWRDRRTPRTVIARWPHFFRARDSCIQIAEPHLQTAVPWQAVNSNWQVSGLGRPWDFVAFNEHVRWPMMTMAMMNTDSL